MSARRSHRSRSAFQPGVPPVLLVAFAIAASLGSWALVLKIAESIGDLTIALTMAAVALVTCISLTSRQRA